MKPHGTYDTAFHAGAASRLAEVKRHASALLHVRKALCGDIHNTEDILDLVESLNKERDQLRKDVMLLRGALNIWLVSPQGERNSAIHEAECVKSALKALDATELK